MVELIAKSLWKEDYEFPPNIRYTAIFEPPLTAQTEHASEIDTILDKLPPSRDLGVVGVVGVTLGATYQKLQLCKRVRLLLILEGANGMRILWLDNSPLEALSLDESCLLLRQWSEVAWLFPNRLLELPIIKRR